MVTTDRAPYSDHDATAAPQDPLRLCVFATVALLGWVLGVRSRCSASRPSD